MGKSGGTLLQQMHVSNHHDVYFKFYNFRCPLYPNQAGKKVKTTNAQNAGTKTCIASRTSGVRSVDQLAGTQQRCTKHSWMRFRISAEYELRRMPVRGLGR